MSAKNHDETTNDRTPPVDDASLVIRDGFPALRLPNGQGPNISDPEALPRHAFWSTHLVLSSPRSSSRNEDSNMTELNSSSRHFDWDGLRQDCRQVFTARTRDDHASYSAGITYFLPAVMKPRCALEALVHSIFQLHTQTLDEGSFLPEQSGAEWWTLVLDDDDDDNKGASDDSNKMQKDGKNDDAEEDDDQSDEVGLHFDADYGLEAQAPGLLLHPRLATVTYLSDFGSPTVVLDKRSPPPSNIQASLEEPITHCYISHPRIGKHVAFDGRLLHGAPATFFPPIQSSPSAAKKRAKHEQTRITLLVNVWLNHCPLDAEPLDEEILESLKAPYNRQGENNIFSWKSNQTNLDTPPPLPEETLSASKDDPAGSEEVVLCGRLVTIGYNASMEEMRDIVTKHEMSLIKLPNKVVDVRVGEEAKEESDGSDGAEEGSEDGKRKAQD